MLLPEPNEALSVKLVSRTLRKAYILAIRLLVPPIVIVIVPVSVPVAVL